MNQHQFDMLARHFATRRLSRRHALAVGGGAVALGLSGAAAHDATPEATPLPGDENRVPFMFVQTFGAGSLAPKDGEDDVLLLTADHLAGQTLYFSDRPERIVGMVSTEQLLGAGDRRESGGLGFTEVDPPNAALVFGDGEAVIVELMNPTYTPATGAVTYEVRVLDEFEQVDLQLVEEPVTAAEAARDFDAASLFIDDCADGIVRCDSIDPNLQFGPMGFCWTGFCCAPCQDPPGGASSWAEACNANYSQCAPDCNPWYDENGGWFACAAQ